MPVQNTVTIFVKEIKGTLQVIIFTIHFFSDHGGGELLKCDLLVCIPRVFLVEKPHNLVDINLSNSRTENFRQAVLEFLFVQKAIMVTVDLIEHLTGLNHFFGREVVNHKSDGLPLKFVFSVEVLHALKHSGAFAHLEVFGFFLQVNLHPRMRHDFRGI